MTRRLVPALILLLLAALLAAGCMGLGAAALAGGVVYYKSSHHESATVHLQARPDRVYDTALETITANPGLQVARQDPGRGLIEVRQGRQDITIKITALSPALTQLAVTSDVKEGAGSTRTVLDRVGDICDKLGVKHYVVK